MSKRGVLGSHYGPRWQSNWTKMRFLGFLAYSHFRIDLSLLLHRLHHEKYFISILRVNMFSLSAFTAKYSVGCDLGIQKVQKVSTWGAKSIQMRRKGCPKMRLNFQSACFSFRCPSGANLDPICFLLSAQENSRNLEEATERHPRGTPEGFLSPVAA